MSRDGQAEDAQPVGTPVEAGNLEEDTPAAEGSHPDGAGTLAEDSRPDGAGTLAEGSRPAAVGARAEVDTNLLRVQGG